MRNISAEEAINYTYIFKMATRPYISILIVIFLALNKLIFIASKCTVKLHTSRYNIRIIVVSCFLEYYLHSEFHILG